MNKLEKNIVKLRKELTELSFIDSRIMEIVRELDSFKINTTRGRIEIYYMRGAIPMSGRFKKNEMAYALELMNFLTRIYYKCNKVIERINSREATVLIDSEFEYFARNIKKQCLKDIKANEKFQNLRFYDEFKEIVELAKKALHHKVDKIGILTTRCVPKELQEIRKIYKQIKFHDDSISYFDYIENAKTVVQIDNTVEIQYMFMVTYMKAYTETILWLSKKEPYGQWYSYTAWQVLEELEKMIYKYFLSIV